MSFTEKVKTELCEAAFPPDLADAFRYGVLYGVRGDKSSLTTDIAALRELLVKFFGEAAAVEVLRRDEKESYAFHFNTERLGGFFGGGGLYRGVLAGDDASTGIFLRGIFISCGTVSVLKAGYHLELALRTEKKCADLLRLINEQGMSIKKSSRRGIPFLYTKNSESIADFLTFIGAMQSSMEIMNIKIFKDFRSGINRAVNCEAANLGKTVAASAEQIADIRIIEERMGLDALPRELSELARVRLDNPDISLSELGKLLEPRISRSGVNHRLERLRKIARQTDSKR